MIDYNFREMFENLFFDVEKLKEQLKDVLNLNLKLKKEINILNKKNIFLLKEIENLKERSSQQTDSRTEERVSLDKQTKKDLNFTNLKALNTENWGISTGNQGVQTDKQTNNQTDKFIEKGVFSTKKTPEEILSSLDSAQKELRLKFKKLTPQELKIFCAIYQLEEEKGGVNYRDLSLKTNLSESSIRDYCRRLTLKEIPLIKEKQNNKEVFLKISPSLRKLASLETILELRSSQF